MSLEPIQLNANMDPGTAGGALQSGLQESALPANPFVGLRPFESQESVLFFGRDKQTVALLQQLHRTRFLAVVGSSGCGKSSLIRAGLIPKLKAGFLVKRRERWTVLTLKPGDSPLRNLATVVLGAGAEEPTEESLGAFVKKMRVEGAEAIVDLIAAQLNVAGANLLLLIDQFEEIFRFVLSAAPGQRQEATADEAAAQAASRERRSDEAARFVSIIMELSQQRALPVYVVLTMRSDFISDYDIFNGLPEAVNGNLYLVPRLDRQQYEDAVKGPIKLYGRDSTPRLLKRVVNDLGGETDQLPVMQHALMRTWENWLKRGDGGPLDLPQYEAAGTIKNALSWDADTALKELNEGEPEIAERLFQALVETDMHGRRVRRPVRLSVIQQITGATPEVILGVIEHFRRDGRCFLTLSSERVEGDPLIDISHESFIRQWDKLREWVGAENESREIYTRLADAALRHATHGGRLWGEDDPDLQQTLDWWKKREPNEAWAVRYHPAFQLAASFLKKSEEKRETDKAEIEERQRLKELESENIRRQNVRLRRFTFALVLISALALAGAGAAAYAFTLARSSEAQAKQSEARATINAELANREGEKALSASTLLEKSLGEAKDAQKEAERQRGLALDAAKKALEEEKRAKAEKVRADQQAAEALKAKEDLRIGNEKGVKALVDARRKLLGDLGGLYQQAIYQSGDKDTAKEAVKTYETIYGIYDKDDVRAGKVSTLLVLGKLHDKPDNISTKEDDLKALGYYERALKLFDLNSSAEKNVAISTLIRMGELYNKSGGLNDGVKAAERYEQAVKLGYTTSSVSDDRNIYQKLGNIYAASQKPGDMRNAIKYYERVLQDLDAELAVNEKSRDGEFFEAALQEKKLAILIPLGTLNNRLGEKQKAKEWYDSAVELVRTKEAGSGEIDVLIDIGMSLNLPGDKQEQAEYFERAIKKDVTASKDPWAAASAYYGIGFRLIFKKDYQTAIPYLKRAAELYHGSGGDRTKEVQEDEARTLTSLGAAYRGTNRKQEALDYYRSALKIYEQLKRTDGVGFLEHTIEAIEVEIKSTEKSPTGTPP
jgi:tetratricopeptide (TPR) repeat protein/energy-coupling factor transporter ATP-binding protein EcfA2